MLNVIKINLGKSHTMLASTEYFHCLSIILLNLCSKTPPTLSWPIRYGRHKTFRETFINFFKCRDHFFVPSSVVPKKDQGTYFINAEMNQVEKSVQLE